MSNTLKQPTFEMAKDTISQFTNEFLKEMEKIQIVASDENNTTIALAEKHLKKVTTEFQKLIKIIK